MIFDTDEIPITVRLSDVVQDNNPFSKICLTSRKWFPEYCLFGHPYKKSEAKNDYEMCAKNELYEALVGTLASFIRFQKIIRMKEMQ